MPTPLETERMISLGLIIAFLFIAVNSPALNDKILGFVYTFFVFVYWQAVEGRAAEYRLSKGVFLDIKALVVPVLIGSAFWFFAVSFIGSNLFGTQAVLASLGQQASLPLLSATTIASSPLLQLAVFGGLIPVAETLFFFGTLLPNLQRWLNIRMGDRKGWIILGAANGAVMALFHLLAQQASQFALISTFSFAFISTLLVLRYQELKQALGVHNAANSAILLARLGVLG